MRKTTSVSTNGRRRHTRRNGLSNINLGTSATAFGRKAGRVFSDLGIATLGARAIRKVGVKRYITKKPLSALGLATLSGIIVGYFLHK